MEILLSIAITMSAGLLMTRIMKPFKLPAVTSYLIAGILIGPFFLGRLGVEGVGFTTHESVVNLKLLSEIALGFIAFEIGNEFRLSQLKQNGKQATVVGCVQAVVATVFVDIALVALHFVLGEDKLPLSAAIVLGAIASATAPAATLMVVKQYKAKGKLTDILLPVVALDDAVGLVIFSVSFGVAKAMESGSFSILSMLVEPMLEVVLSLVLGTALGFIFSFVEKLFLSNSKRLSLAVTFVLMAVALSKIEFTLFGINIAFSSLLVCMMMGTIFCNICNFSEEIMEKTDRWTMPIYIIFFVLSGAELELNVFADLSIVGIGLVFILFRSLGKYIGAFFSAKATKCDPTICKYLGITLLPQAGVALGMSITAMSLGEQCGSLVRNIVLFVVMIYELIGPTLTKISLTKAGDIKPKSAGASVVEVTDEDDD